MHNQDATPNEEEDDLSDADLAEMAAALQENLAAAYRPSHRRLAAILLTIGCATMATVGFLPNSLGLWRLPIYFAAIIILFWGLFARDYRYPESCLIVLLDMNATFWAAHIFWLLRLHFATHPPGWVDPYPPAQVVWLLPLASFAPLQAIVFWSGIRVGRQRSTAFVGMMLLILQFFTTWRTAHQLSGLH